MSAATAIARAAVLSTSTISRQDPRRTSAKAQAWPTAPTPTIPTFRAWLCAITPPFVRRRRVRSKPSRRSGDTGVAIATTSRPIELMIRRGAGRCPEWSLMCRGAPSAMVRRDARADFERALRAHFLARISRLLTARRLDRTRPRHLGAAAALGWQSTRLRSIPLDAIVGTVDPTTDFDADFHPAAQRVAARWQRIARAHRVGRELPPISVIEQPDGYYVLDGRHRV